MVRRGFLEVVEFEEEASHETTRAGIDLGKMVLHRPVELARLIGTSLNWEELERFPLAIIVPMSKYEWRLVRTRYVIAMLSGVLLITFIFLGPEGTQQRLAPCPDIDLHFFTS